MSFGPDLAAMNNVPAAKLTLRQALFLLVVVPIFFLLTLEMGARVLEIFWASKSSGANAPQVLEMPTWMLKEANSTTRPKVDKDDLEWLNLFQEGNGYRVNLKPNTSANVKNTFSLIPSDRNRRRVIQSNSIGFRSPEISRSKPTSTFRILVFGDSSSFGWGVNAEESWSSLLQKRLQEEHPKSKIEVANFAIPGDSSAYGRLIFDAFAPEYESDLVILGFGANDAKLVFTSHTDQVSRFSNNSLLGDTRRLLRHSALFRGFERALAPKRPSAEEVAKKLASQRRVAAVSRGAYADNLTYMAAKARELGNRNALILTLCTPGDYAREARVAAKRTQSLSFNGQGSLIRLISKAKSGEAYPQYVQAMQESYPSSLRQNDRFYITSDGCHPNELGHRYIADRVASIIDRAGLIGG